MHRGYVKLWRKSKDSGLMNNAKLWLFWTWCLMKASHKKTTVLVGYQNVEINPGEFVFGRRKAASTLHLSEMVIRRCLESLKIAERITTKTTNKYTIVKIINWETYQSDLDTNNQQDNQQQITQTTNNEPTTSQQRATNKNVKECIRNNGNIPYQKIIDLYHQLLPDNPECRILSEKRKKQIKARWSSATSTKAGNLSNTIKFWEILFEFIGKSRFLTGQIDPQEGHSRFYADIEWITKESNFIKIIEGKYHE